MHETEFLIFSPNPLHPQPSPAPLMGRWLTSGDSGHNASLNPLFLPAPIKSSKIPLAHLSGYAPTADHFVTQAQATHPLVGHSGHLPAGPAFSNMLPISVFSAQSQRDPLKT